MSGIYNHLVRVFGKNSRNERPSSEEEDDQSRLIELTEIQTNENEPGHYQQGIPGIPTNGKVVLLRNSITGALLYLIGTVHGSEQSAATVKQVIGDIRPDVVALGFAFTGLVWIVSYGGDCDELCGDLFYICLCETRASRVMNWKPEDDAIQTLFWKSMRAPGGLCLKLGLFFLNLKLRRLRANGIIPELEFKVLFISLVIDVNLFIVQVCFPRIFFFFVLYNLGFDFQVAIKESIRVKARCAYIDQDIDVMLQNFIKASPLELFRNAYNTRVREVNGEGCTRSSVWKMQSGIELKKATQETLLFTFKVMTEDRDMLMFTKLRGFEGKVVAVVGMGHMDGIERLWMRAEEDDNSGVRQI
ncbi:hypothetical protein MKW98_022968 [Papaver atlanticum]|uniref:TraB domain-containing protein n=1 Tax=Papaver atlanticum TaxID=357466 RepID=A0AAD4TA61_9MAGN|nr:hypothetical protein MKW98_022968 [Papaver atlanticum]